VATCTVVRYARVASTSTSYFLISMYHWYILYVECKRHCISFLWIILVPKSGLTYSWKFEISSRLIHLAYLAKIPDDFRVICLWLFCDTLLMSLFSLLCFTSTVAHPTSLYIGMLFSLCFFVIDLFAYYLRLIGCILLLSFTTFEKSSFTNWFVLATGLSEQLTHTVFHWPFLFRTYVLEHNRQFAKPWVSGVFLFSSKWH